MSQLWVSDVTIPLLRHNFFWSNEWREECDYVDVVDCELVEFPEFEKVFAFYHHFSFLDILDVSPKCDRTFLGRVFTGVPLNVYMQHSMACSFRYDEEVNPLRRQVDIALISSGASSSPTICSLVSVQFTFSYSAEDVVVCPLNVAGWFGHCHSSTDVDTKLFIKRAVLLGPSALLVQQPARLSVWFFELEKEDGMEFQTLNDNGIVCLQDSVQRLSCFVHPINALVRFSSDEQKRSSAVTYLKNLFGFPHTSVNGLLAEWRHMCICPFTRTTAGSSTLCDDRGFLCYSIQTYFHDPEIHEQTVEDKDINEDACCAACGMDMNRHRFRRPFVKRVICFTSVPLNAPLLNLPFTVVSDLGDVMNDNLQQMKHAGDVFSCPHCLFQRWMQDATLYTLLECSTTGSTVCIYHITPEIIFHKESSKEKNEENDPSGHNSLESYNTSDSEDSVTPVVQRQFSMTSEFCVFRKCRTSLPTHDHEFEEFKRFSIPGIPSHIHPLEMKVTDHAVWILYPSIDTEPRRLFRVSLKHAEEGLQELNALEEDQKMSESNDECIYMKDPKVCGAWSEEGISEESKDYGTLSTTIASELHSLMRQCSPYDRVEDNVQLFSSPSKVDITEVMQFPQESNAFQLKSDICLLPSVFLGLLRFVLDDLALHPYDVAHMNSITENFLTCTTQLFTERPFFSDPSRFMYHEYLYKACLDFLCKMNHDVDTYKKEDLKTLLEVVLTVAIRDAAEHIGVLGPQPISQGAAHVASFLNQYCTEAIKSEKIKIRLSKVYGYSYIETPKMDYSRRDLYSDVYSSGVFRPLVLGYDTHMSVVVRLTNIFDIWNHSMSLWLSRGLLAVQDTHHTQLVNMLNSRSAADWLYFLVVKLNSYTTCTITASSSADNDLVVSLESEMLCDVLASLYQCLGQRKVSTGQLLNCLMEIHKINFKSFEFWDHPPPSVWRLYIEPCRVYDLLVHLASVSSSNLSSRLIRFRSFLKVMVNLPLDWAVSDDVLKNMNHVLCSRFQVKHNVEDTESPYGELVCLDSTSSCPYHIMLSSSVMSQLMTAKLMAFILVYFSRWVSRHLKSTFRRFEMVNGAQCEMDSSTERSTLIWWDLCVGGGSQGACVLDGLALGANGDLSQKDLTDFLELQRDFEIKFSLWKATCDFFIESHTLSRQQTIALLVNHALLFCKNKGIKNPIPSASFLTPSIIFNPVFIYDTYAAGAHLCSNWLDVILEYADDASARVTPGFFFYVKGFCEAFWLRSVKYSHSTMPFSCVPEHLSWDAICDILSAAVKYDSWVLEFDAHSGKNHDTLFLLAKSNDSSSQLLCPLQRFVIESRNVSAIPVSANTGDSPSSPMKCERFISLVRGSICYCLHACWILKVTDAPLQEQVSFLKRAATYLEKFEGVSVSLEDHLSRAKSGLSRLIFNYWCRVTVDSALLGMKEACILLEESSYLRQDAQDLLGDLLESGIQALESGTLCVDEVFSIMESITNPVLMGILLTYLARLTLILPPTSIRARFVVQLFHTHLLKRLKNPYQAALHCVIMASLLELRLKAKPSATLLSTGNAKGYQLPTSLLRGLAVLLYHLQRNELRDGIGGDSLWDKLQRFVIESRGIGPDCIECLNIQKNFIHSAVMHLDALDSSSLNALLIPHSYFGVKISSDDFNATLNGDDTLSQICCIERDALQFLDMLTVLKLELLGCVNRSTHDQEAKNQFQTTVLNASPEHTVSLLAFSGALQKLSWCLRAWEFVSFERVAEIFLYSLISSHPEIIANRYHAHQLPLSTGGSPEFYEESRKRFKDAQSAATILKTTEHLQSTVHTVSSQPLTGVFTTKETMCYTQHIKQAFAAPIFRESPEALWTLFIHMADALYSDKPTSSFRYQLIHIFGDLILYKEMENIALPHSLMTWIYTHPLHTAFPLALIQHLLSYSCSTVIEKAIRDFLTHQIESVQHCSMSIIPFCDILHLDALQSALNRQLFRTFIKKKIRLTIA